MKAILLIVFYFVITNQVMAQGAKQKGTTKKIDIQAKESIRIKTNEAYGTIGNIIRSKTGIIINTDSLRHQVENEIKAKYSKKINNFIQQLAEQNIQDQINKSLIARMIDTIARKNAELHFLRQKGINDSLSTVALSRANSLVISNKDTLIKDYKRMEVSLTTELDAMKEIAFKNSVDIFADQNPPVITINSTPTTDILLNDNNNGKVVPHRVIKLKIKAKIYEESPPKLKLRIFYTDIYGEQFTLLNNLQLTINLNEIYNEFKIDFKEAQYSKFRHKKVKHDYTEGNFEAQIYYEKNQQDKIKKSNSFTFRT